MNITIAYDTSCYTTSVAAVDENFNIVANVRKLLPVKFGDRGLRQSEAIFKHLQQINELNAQLFNCLKDLDFKVLAISASVKPREASNSYMPVFLVGEQFAKQLSLFSNAKFIPCNHQLGHLYAAKYNSGISNNHFLGFHLSGGTTELVEFENNSVSLLGSTLDISFGQLVDRIGVSMGLQFPAGIHLEKLAMKSNKINIPLFSSTVKQCNCNLSGLEAQAKRSQKDFLKEDIAYALYNSLANCASKMIFNAHHKTKLNRVLLFGGVASSELFRTILIEKMFKKCKNINLFFGRNDLCSDNAVGVALYAMEVIKNAKQSN